RYVRRVMSEIENEWLIARTVDEFQRFVCQPIGQVFARLTIFQVWDVSQFFAPKTLAAVGKEVGLWRAPERAADVEIKALSLWIVGCVAKMPLANKRRTIPGIVEYFGQSLFALGKVCDGNGWN